MKKHDNSVILFSSALLIALFFINIIPFFQNNAYGKIINEKNIVTSLDIENEGFLQLESVADIGDVREFPPQNYYLDWDERRNHRGGGKGQGDKAQAPKTE